MLTIEEILKSTGGKVLADRCVKSIRSVSINTRTIKAKSLFVAIKGANHDGHDFLSKAIKGGAIVVLVSKKVKLPGVTIIYVKDTVKALGQLARVYRSKFNIPIIAITGSAGKTTTKDLIAKVFSTQFNVLKNERSENNWIGVPLTIFKIKPSTQVAILELGTNQNGDIAWLTSIVKPDVAILTNIGDSHLQGLKNKAGVFKEKIQILKGLDENGCVIYNADDPYLSRIKKLRSKMQKISFSVDNPSDYQATHLECGKSSKTTFKVARKVYYLNVLGKHQVYNALSAISCSKYFKISYNSINNSLKLFKSASNRGSLKKLGSIWIYNDTYNSNPLSFKIAINVLKELRNPGRKIAVCADMLELGAKSQMLHRSMAHTINNSGLDFLILYGPESKWMLKELKKIESMINVVHCKTHGEIHTKLRRYVKPGDAVLVKGSRSMKMEKTTDYLYKYANQ